MLLGPWVARPLMVLSTYVWPGYQSYKAAAAGNAQALHQWTIFWTVVAAFLSVEWLMDATLFWLPLYYESKLLFVVFLWHPRTQGAVLLFEKFVRPLLHVHEATIDSTLEEAKARIADGVTRQFSRARDLAQGNASKILEQMRSFSDPKRPALRAAPVHARAD